MFSNGYELEQRVSSFMAGVYGWMSCGLAITAGVSYYVAMTPAIFAYIYTHSGVLIGLFLAQMAFGFAITLFINRMSFITALVLFLLYAATVGITLTLTFSIYTQSSIISTFLVTAGMFGIMSLYGYVTTSDLTTIGNLSFMLLVGLFISLLINMFLQSAQFDYILSGVGVIVFVLLIAYDTQRIKQMARPMLVEQDVMSKITLLGAFTLYLDLILLFRFLLRFMGNRRE